MRTRTLLLLSSSIAACIPSLHGADTVSDFSGIGNTPATIFQAGQGSAPAIITEGANAFLRLIYEEGSQSNHYAFDATNDGNWNTMAGQFDFRFTNTTGEPADGIGMLFIPESRAGIAGPGLSDFIAEEPNTAGTLAVGVDLYSNVNDLSLHWNGFEQTNAYTNPANVNFLNTGWNRVSVAYTQVGNGLNATVQVTRDVLGTPVNFMRLSEAIDARPYANRVQFSGRTGGSDMVADIDNVLATYAGTAALLPTIDAGRRVWQDFDSLGATGYTARLHTPSPDEFRVGPTLVGTGGSGGGAYMRLVPDGQNSTLASISFRRAPDAGLAPARRVEMDFRMTNPDGITPADGMGILLLPTSTYNIAGAGPSLAYEDPNVPNALGVGFRVYDGGAVNRVQLHWNGARVAELNVGTDTLPLTSGEWHRMQLETEVAVGGSNVSLSVVRDVNGIATSVPIFTNQFVPGLVPYDYRIQTGARTGGLNVQADVDNIRTFAKGTSYVEINNTLFQNFDGPGTYYQATDQHGIIPATDGTRHPAILSGGPSGNYLRLAHAVNGQNPQIGFNQVIPSGSAKQQVEASFEFRMSGQVAPNERADGFGFGLFGVNTYGTSGPLIEGEQLWETPIFFDALTLGVRIYDADGTSSTDYLTLNWSGFTVFSRSTAEIPGLWDLNNDLFHRAKLTLTDAGTEALATLEIAQDPYGANNGTLTIFSDLIIPGLDLDTFDFRAGIGARTGGLNANMDFDNIVVIPEPSSALLALTGLGFVTARRRRR